MTLTKLSLGRNNDVIYKLFLPRESLVSGILAGDGNIEKLFYGVQCKQFPTLKYFSMISDGFTPLQFYSIQSQSLAVDVLTV
jgi:hypothetical protein